MLETPEYNRIERATWITFQLYQGGVFTAADLADRFGVSTRTIQRDLASIERLVPIERDHGIVRLLNWDD